MFTKMSFTLLIEHTINSVLNLRCSRLCTVI